MQAQAPDAPYVGLWTRLAGFRASELTRLVHSRAAVRTTLMRVTIHLATARDCLALHPALQPMIEHRLHTASPYGRQLTGIDVNELLEVGREVHREPRTRAELRARLADRFPDRNPNDLAYAITYLLPLAHATPRGIWRRGGSVRLVDLTEWLGRPLANPIALPVLVRRYLAAPRASPTCRAGRALPVSLPVVATMRSRLRSFRDERGRELLDLPDVPRPDPATPAPPRFLPEYDNVLLAHADRSRILVGNQGPPAPPGNGGSRARNGMRNRSGLPLRLSGRRCHGRGPGAGLPVHSR